MPKLSFAQEMYEMERVVAAARSNVDILPDPDLALALADQLAAIIAEAKELKSLQQALLAAQMVKTQEMAVLVHRGTWVVRRLRAYVLLVLGTRNAQLTQFGIRLRRRPRRKVHNRSEALTEPTESMRDDRPEDRRSRAIVEPDGATVTEIGGTVLQLGGEDSGLGADIASPGAAAPPERGTVPPLGGTAAEDRAIVPEDRADANRRGAIVPETRGTTIRAV